MKKYFRLAGIATFIGIVAFTLSACGHHRHDPEDKAEWIAKKITRKLDLDELQQQKLKAVTDEFVAHHKAHRSQKREHMDKLLSEIRKPELDKSVLNQVVNEHQARINEMAPSIIDKLAEFHASLNDEQKEKLAEKLEHFKNHHHDDD